MQKILAAHIIAISFFAVGCQSELAAGRYDFEDTKFNTLNKPIQKMISSAMQRRSWETTKDWHTSKRFLQLNGKYNVIDHMRMKLFGTVSRHDMIAESKVGKRVSGTTKTHTSILDYTDTPNPILSISIPPSIPKELFLNKNHTHVYKFPATTTLKLFVRVECKWKTAKFTMPDSKVKELPYSYKERASFYWEVDGALELIELTDNFEDIHVAPNYLDTPLHSVETLGVCKQLLQNGADQYALNGNSAMPFLVAISRGRNEIGLYLARELAKEITNTPPNKLIDVLDILEESPNIYLRINARKAKVFALNGPEEETAVQIQSVLRLKLTN